MNHPIFGNVNLPVRPSTITTKAREDESNEHARHRRAWPTRPRLRRAARRSGRWCASIRSIGRRLVGPQTGFAASRSRARRFGTPRRSSRRRLGRAGRSRRRATSVTLATCIAPKNLYSPTPPLELLVDRHHDAAPQREVESPGRRARPEARDARGAEGRAPRIASRRAGRASSARRAAPSRRRLRRRRGDRLLGERGQRRRRGARAPAYDAHQIEPPGRWATSDTPKPR